MLTWAHPWVLVGLFAVAGVAVWALLRRDRQQATVATLAFWRAAREHLSAVSFRRTRRVSAHWLLLLLGAVCAILAAGGPAVQPTGLSRRIALRLVTSAELGRDGTAAMRKSVEALLARLDPADRVALLTPAGEGTPGRWMSPADAHSASRSVEPLPVAARDTIPLPPPSDAQAVFTFAPAGTSGDWPSHTLVELPTDLPAVTFDAIGAADLPDGKTQLLLALRNHTAEPRREGIELGGIDPGGRPIWGRRVEVTIPARSRLTRTFEVNSAAGIYARIGDGPSQSAQLARRERPVLPVAMIGPDRRNVRRFVEADPMLELVADANDADAVIAIHATPPADKPALVLSPANAPPGWRLGRPIGPLTLASADVAADDPVMRDVDLAAVAVRRVAPWIATGDRPQVRLVTIDGDALALRTPDRTAPRRVWIAIDPAPENTDLALHYPMLIWLRNAMSFLLDEAGERGAVYEFTSASLGHPGWAPVARNSRSAENVLAPGMYSAGDEDLRAVNLLGLRGRRPTVDPVAGAKELTLPPPTTSESPLELGWILAILAGVCWLAGWWLRVGGGQVRSSEG